MRRLIGTNLLKLQICGNKTDGGGILNLFLIGALAHIFCAFLFMYCHYKKSLQMAEEPIERCVIGPE